MQLVETATDEFLSDPDIHYLILYNGQADLVRKGIEHFLKAADLPADQDALILVLR